MIDQLTHNNVKESEGILAHTVAGTIALTADGKKAYVFSYSIFHI